MKSVLGYYRLGQAYPRRALREPYPPPARAGPIPESVGSNARDGRRADSLRLKISSTEIDHLAKIGAVPGVVILAVAARNGPGIGRLRSDSVGLQWQAPGSNTLGSRVPYAGDGAYLLEDGEDRDKWIRVQLYASYLATCPTEDRVYLDDRYNNGPPHDDVTAAEASAGSVETYTIQMLNESPRDVYNLRVWLDAATPSLEISDDGSTWVSPTTEGTALSFETLIPGQMKMLHLRRTVSAGASADPDVLVLLDYSFDTP